ncbi:MAG: thiamine pyrophosphate-binding protein, partial [Candidatus Shapirobacteria bacterium]|nr:thiamine pyrophosphate-binding protein [Candidatus Shapirobacteria bacterium]
NKIRYELEKAVNLATSGRPGPVWVEIPLDIQAEEISEKELKGYTVDKKKKNKSIPIDEVVKMLETAKRPLLIAGYGIRISGGIDELNKFLKNTGINVVTPMFTAGDVVTYDYKNYLGRQGMPGTVTANYAVDNCDLMLIIGERMQLTQTSYDYKNFASNAKKIMVDVDEGELFKKTLKIDLPILDDAKDFLEELNKKNIRINKWKVERVEINYKDYGKTKKFINVYEFIGELKKYSRRYPVATANGMASVVPNQALVIKRGQRMMTNAGLGQMGSGLPMAIGACIACGKKPTICMEGDGSLMLNIQELQTVIFNRLPIKLFIYNNSGYFSIRNTHQNYFGKVFAADKKSGVDLPNYENLIKGWGVKYEKIQNSAELKKLKGIFKYKGPVVCELMINPNQLMLSKWSAGTYKENI